jgi:hypothetical protein
VLRTLARTTTINVNNQTPRVSRKPGQVQTRTTAFAVSPPRLARLQRRRNASPRPSGVSRRPGGQQAAGRAGRVGAEASTAPEICSPPDDDRASRRRGGSGPLRRASSFRCRTRKAVSHAARCFSFWAIATVASSLLDRRLRASTKRSCVGTKRDPRSAQSSTTDGRFAGRSDRLIAAGADPAAARPERSHGRGRDE